LGVVDDGRGRALRASEKKAKQGIKKRAETDTY
jgi:hypothetical protein